MALFDTVNTIDLPGVRGYSLTLRPEQLADDIARRDYSQLRAIGLPWFVEYLYRVSDDHLQALAICSTYLGFYEFLHSLTGRERLELNIVRNSCENSVRIVLLAYVEPARVVAEMPPALQCTDRRLSAESFGIWVSDREYQATPPLKLTRKRAEELLSSGGSLYGVSLPQAMTYSFCRRSPETESGRKLFLRLLEISRRKGDRSMSELARGLKSLERFKHFWLQVNRRPESDGVEIRVFGASKSLYVEVLGSRDVFCLTAPEQRNKITVASEIEENPSNSERRLIRTNRKGKYHVSHQQHQKHQDSIDLRLDRRRGRTPR